MTDKDPMNEGKGCCFVSASHMMWWMTLIVAVLSVPAFALIVASVIPATGFGQVAVFILACWACTYLGMRLMQHPRMAELLTKKIKD